MRDVYVAGSTKERGRVRAVQELCKAQGWSITFDWTTTEEEGGEGGIRTSWAEEPERARELAKREIRAIFEADLFILVWPVASPGLGCHYETAWAMVGGAEVWIIGCPRDLVFFYLNDSIERFPDINFAMTAITYEGRRLREKAVP